MFTFPLFTNKLIKDIPRLIGSIPPITFICFFFVLHTLCCQRQYSPFLISFGTLSQFSMLVLFYLFTNYFNSKLVFAKGNVSYKSTRHTVLLVTVLWKHSEDNFFREYIPRHCQNVAAIKTIPKLLALENSLSKQLSHVKRCHDWREL